MYGTPWALYDSIAIPTGNNDRDHCNQVRLSPAHKNKTHAQASMGFELSLNSGYCAAVFPCFAAMTFREFSASSFAFGINSTAFEISGSHCARASRLDVSPN